MRRFLLFISFCFMLLMPLAATEIKVVEDFSTENIWKLPTSNQNAKGTGTFTSTTGYKYNASWANSCYWNNSSKYLMLGKSNSYIEFPAFDGKVTKVEISNSSGCSTKVSVQINDKNDKEIVAAKTFSSTSSTYTYVIPSDKQVEGQVLRLAVTNKYNVQISKITITVESTAGGGSETLSFDKSSVELTYGDVFTAPTLSKAEGKTLTWNSSNTAVATVDGSGNVEIKGIGTTTITATEKDNSSNSASYTITVKDPNAIEDDVIVHGIFDGDAGGAYAKEGSYTSGNGIIYKAQYSNTNGIQLNKNTASPGIVVTENPRGYVLSKIIVEWNSNCAADRDLEIIGSNEAFTGTADLNATAVGATVNKGTKLGALKSVSETEFDVLATGYYCYIGLRALAVVNISKITLVWTRVEPEFKADITIAVDETEGDANAITFNRLQESHGLAFDLSGYSVYLNGTEIGGTDGSLAYLPFVPDGKFTISNGTYTYPIAVKWPITDFSTIEAKVTKAEYFAYCDEEHTVTGWEDSMWYLDAEYTIAPDCEVSNLYCEVNCTLFDPDNALGSTVEKKGNNIVCVNRVGMFMLGEAPTFETNVDGSFNVTLTFPFYVQTALKGMMLPAYTEKITSFEGVETLIDVTALAGQVPQPGDEGGKISGVESVVVDSEGAVEYYNLQGVRVEGALTPGIYIRRTATGTSKVAIR